MQSFHEYFLSKTISKAMSLVCQVKVLYGSKGVSTPAPQRFDRPNLGGSLLFSADDKPVSFFSHVISPEVASTRFKT